MKTSQLEIFQPDFKPIHLGCRAYRVSDTKVAKIFEESQMPELERELRIGRTFYENGIAVPQPYGIYSIARKQGLFRRIRYNPCLIREYLEGFTLNNVSPEDFPKARDSFHEQIDKSEKLGYDAWDMHWGNGLWVPKKQITYLIDLDSFDKINWRAA